MSRFELVLDSTWARLDHIGGKRQDPPSIKEKQWFNHLVVYKWLLDLIKT